MKSKISFKNLIQKWSPLIAVASLIAASCTCWSSNTPPPAPTPPPPIPTPACTMSFISPTAGALPTSGPVNFEWTAVPNTAVYVFAVKLPDSSNVTWSQKGTSKTVYMENYTGSGTYQFIVQARDSDDNILCQAEIDFSKDQFIKPKKPEKPIIPSNPLGVP